MTVKKEESTALAAAMWEATVMIEDSAAASSTAREQVATQRIGGMAVQITKSTNHDDVMTEQPLNTEQENVIINWPW